MKMDRILMFLLCVLILNAFVAGYVIGGAYGLIDLNDEVEDKNNNYYPYNMTRETRTTTTPQLIFPEPMG